MPPPWQLSAPEAHVLQYRGGCWRDEPFKLAVKELVARSVLRVERRPHGRLPGGSPRQVLVDGPLIESEVAAPLTAVLAAYRKALSRSRIVVCAGRTTAKPMAGVSIDALRKAAREEFGAVKRYHLREVVPVLVDRGLLTPAATRGRRGKPNYDWTAAGRQADAELEEWMALGRRSLPVWRAEGDLRKGAAYLAGAGASCLLTPEIYLERHRLELRSQRVAAGFDTSDRPDTADQLDVDLGGLDAAFGGMVGVDGAGDLGGSGGGGDGGGVGGGGGGGGG